MKPTLRAHCTCQSRRLARLRRSCSLVGLSGDLAGEPPLGPAGSSAGEIVPATKNNHINVLIYNAMFAIKPPPMQVYM